MINMVASQGFMHQACEKESVVSGFSGLHHIKLSHSGFSQLFSTACSLNKTSSHLRLAIFSATQATNSMGGAFKQNLASIQDPASINKLF